ncbi:MAG: M23 family metallopeptidase [Jatrophihabitans sp.]
MVERPFAAPTNPYGPGHRGVDLLFPAGDPVHVAASGRVTFAGSVAGRGIVVVAHSDGIRTEYEPVTPVVRRGETVTRGDTLGALTGRHPGCPVVNCLHWGARRGQTYLDPLTLLQPLGAVRLLPWPTR